MKKEFKITGMTCSACSAHVEKAVSRLEGIEFVAVNLLTEKMEVRYQDTGLDELQIIQAVEKAGYGASLLSENQAQEKKPKDQSEASYGDQELSQMKLRLRVSFCFMIPLMLFAMYPMYSGILFPQGLPFAEQYLFGTKNAITFGLTQILLLLPIMYVNRKFYIVGLKSLWNKSPNMDTLVALGSLAAAFYGVFAIYRMGYGYGHQQPEIVAHYIHDLYFESAGMILTLVTVGKYLEAKSKKKTGDAIKSLMDMSPKTAILVLESGEEREVPIEQLKIGQHFAVKPGGAIPVDGQVVWGTTFVDEAALTGESVPVEKKAGDVVLSGTMNKNGYIRCVVQKEAKDSTLWQMIRLVEAASGTKAPIAKLADTISYYFVPIVISLAILTTAIWLLLGKDFEFAISCGIAVLVISCPCALGLATPVAIMVGTGVGAKNGILMKSGEALETFRHVQTMVFDKTGTITKGALEVKQVTVFDASMEKQGLLRLTAALEHKSEHPLGEAVIREAGRLGISGLPEITQFQAHFGKGISGYYEDNKCLYVGNQRYLEEAGFVLTEAMLKQQEEYERNGFTPLWVGEKQMTEAVACSHSVLGLLGVADELKKEARQVVEGLKKQGIEVIMLTGDKELTAWAVARQVGIESVISQVLPQDKESHIRALQQQGKRVCMVGDGINDAPALTAADVGIAIGAGADIAIDSADIVLMKNHLGDCLKAYMLSKAVIRNIKQNLFWAFFYNCIGIPLAAGVLYDAAGIRLNPMFGAAAMSLSSLFVVTNALRLRYFKAETAELQEDVTEDIKCEEHICVDNQEKEKKEMIITMKVEGMMCGHCTGRVQKALEEVPGVTHVEMSLENKQAVVTTEVEGLERALMEAVEKAGYENSIV